MGVGVRVGPRLIPPAFRPARLQVVQALGQAGEIHMAMGLSRESDYYLAQGLELADGCVIAGTAAGAAGWRLGFLRRLAQLRLLQGQVRLCA